MPRVTFAGACNRPEFFEWHLASLMDAARRTAFEAENLATIGSELVLAS